MLWRDRAFPFELVPADRGTEPVIRVMAEGDDERTIKSVVSEVVSALSVAAAYHFRSITADDIGSLTTYFGARLARMRCSVRRCMLRRRAVSETLRLQSS